MMVTLVIKAMSELARCCGTHVTTASRTFYDDDDDDDGDNDDDTPGCAGRP